MIVLIVECTILELFFVCYSLRGWSVALGVLNNFSNQNNDRLRGKKTLIKSYVCHQLMTRLRSPWMAWKGAVKTDAHKVGSDQI